MSLMMMGGRRLRPIPPRSGPTGPTWYARTSDPFVPNLEASAVTCAFKVFIPTSYSNSTPHRIVYQWPDSGVRGTDNTSQLTAGLSRAIIANTAGTYTQATWPTIVVAMQYPATHPTLGTTIGAGGRRWGFPMFPAVMNAVEREWNINPSKRIGTGFSLGGNTALEILTAYRSLFAGVFVTECNISLTVADVAAGTNAGTATTQVATAASTLPIKQYQAIDDASMPFSVARTVRDAFIAVGNPNYEYIEIPAQSPTPLTHNTAEAKFYNDAGNTLYPWLMSL